MFVWNIADGDTLTVAPLLVQVNDVTCNIKNPFYDIQNESELKYKSPEMRVNNSFVTLNQSDDPDFNVSDLWKL